MAPKPLSPDRSTARTIRQSGLVWVESAPVEVRELLARLASAAVIARPDWIEGWRRHAIAQEQIGQLESAAESLEMAVGHFPEVRVLVQEAVRIRQMLHQFDRASEIEGRWLTAHPDDVDARQRQFLLFVRSGRLTEAERILDGVAAACPAAPGVIEMKFRRALRDGRFELVVAHCNGVLADNPGHADALFFKAWALHRLGRAAEMRSITEIEPLVRIGSMPVPDSFRDMTDFLDTLAAEIARNPTLLPDPAGKSTRNGVQALNLLQSGNRATACLIQEIRRGVENYIRWCETLDQSWAHAVPERATLRCWAIMLGPDGFHTTHRHPSAWLSGVFYIAAPRRDTDGSFAGTLVIGAPFSNDPADQNAWLARRIEPVPGRIVMFPSFAPHATEPTGCPGQRIAVAFDVTPV